MLKSSILATRKYYEFGLTAYEQGRQYLNGVVKWGAHGQRDGTMEQPVLHLVRGVNVTGLEGRSEDCVAIVGKLLTIPVQKEVD